MKMQELKKYKGINVSIEYQTARSWGIYTGVIKSVGTVNFIISLPDDGFYGAMDLKLQIDGVKELVINND